MPIRFELRPDQLKRPHAALCAPARQEVKGEATPRTHVHAVSTPAATREPEESPRLVRAVAVAAPVRPVGAITASKDNAVQRPWCPLDVGEQFPHDCDAVDAVRECATNELVLGPVRDERRVAAYAHSDVQMLPAGIRRKAKTDSRHLPERGYQVLAELTLDDVHLAVPEQIGDLGVECVCLKANDYAIQVRAVWPPVVGVTPKDKLLPTVPPFEEESAASDRPARARIVDRVPPDVLEVLPLECVLWEHEVEQRLSPEEEPRTEDDLDSLRIDATDTEDSGLVRIVFTRWVLQSRPIGELEVTGSNRNSVAPASLGADVVSERERRLRRDVDVRDELRATAVTGTDLVRAVENRRGNGVQALTDEDVEARELHGRDHHCAAALRRLRVRAARARNPEERDGDRRE